MKRILTTFLAILLLCLAACQRTPTWEEEYERGMKLLSDGSYTQAVIAFTAAIAIDPKQAPAYAGRGEAYMETAKLASGDITDPSSLPDEARSAYEKAIADFVKGAELDAAVVDYYRSAADAYLALGKTEEAIAILQKGFEVTGDEGLSAAAEELTAEDSPTSGDGSEPEGDPSGEEPGQEENPPLEVDEEAMYTEYLAGGGWNEIEIQDLPGDHQINFCLGDFDGDSVRELLLRIPYADQMSFMNGGKTALLDIDTANHEVILSQVMDHTGGSAGNAFLELKYDTEEQRPVLTEDSWNSTGIWYQEHYLRVYSNDFTSLVYDLISTEIVTQNNPFDEFVQTANEMRAETDLYTETDDSIIFYRMNGEYVREEDFNTVVSQYVDPEPYGLEMKASTIGNPLGL